LQRFLRDLWTIPNAMSMFRVIAAPLLIFMWISWELWWASLVLGTIIGLTDQIDGWVARKLNQTTELGAIIDQLGDLVFEGTTLLLAVLTGEMWFGVYILYLFREFTVNVVRAYMLAHGGQLPSSILGKAKSSCIQWAFFLFFLGNILENLEFASESWTMVGITPGRVLIWVALTSIFTGISMGLISAWKYLRAFVDFYGSQQRDEK
jgi:cardiolipin synthase (CMP-forming)